MVETNLETNYFGNQNHIANVSDQFRNKLFW